MMDRPRLTIPPDRVDRMINQCTIGLIIIQGVLSCYSYIILPETIPIHFNLEGDPNGYGSKASLFFLPALCLATFLGLSKLNQYPHTFNYPVNLTPENVERQYRLAQKLMRWVNLAMSLICLMVLTFLVQSAITGSAPSSIILIVIITCLALLPVVIYLTVAYKKN